MWLKGTDLGDLYRGTLSLRQVWVRVQALGSEATPTPLHHAIHEAEERLAVAQREADLDDVMNRYRKE